VGKSSSSPRSVGVEARERNTNDKVITSVYRVYAPVGPILVEERRVITTRRPEAITDQTSTDGIAELEAAAAIVVKSHSYRVIRKRRSFASGTIGLSKRLCRQRTNASEGPGRPGSHRALASPEKGLRILNPDEPAMLVSVASPIERREVARSIRESCNAAGNGE